jgi:hypothetical protein
MAAHHDERDLGLSLIIQERCSDITYQGSGQHREAGRGQTVLLRRQIGSRFLLLVRVDSVRHEGGDGRPGGMGQQVDDAHQMEAAADRLREAHGGREGVRGEV